MPTPEFLIEIGARALCEAHGYDPDLVVKSRDKSVQELLYIDGEPVPNWKHHVRDAKIVINAIFDQHLTGR